VKQISSNWFAAYTVDETESLLMLVSATLGLAIPVVKIMKR